MSFIKNSKINVTGINIYTIEKTNGGFYRNDLQNYFQPKGISFISEQISSYTPFNGVDIDTMDVCKEHSIRLILGNIKK